MKLSYQVGAESIVEGKRVGRLATPPKTVTVDDTFGALLLQAQKTVDETDAQPGDGEIDLRIDEFSPELVAKFPLLKKVNLMPGEQYLFLRLRKV